MVEAMMNEMAEPAITRDGSGAAAILVVAVSILLLMPLIGQLVSCVFWAYVTHADFNPLYQD